MDRTVPRGVIVKSIPPAAVIMKLDDASVNLAGTVRFCGWIEFVLIFSGNEIW